MSPMFALRVPIRTLACRVDGRSVGAAAHRQTKAHRWNPGAGDLKLDRPC